MDQIEIVVGTYENLILGYKIQEKIGGGLTLETSFTTDSHRGALRCLALSPQGVLASTSTDDSIRLHSLKKRREVGSLFQHDGSVNCIRFFHGHMFSASEDGTICLWKCKTWELLRLLKGHKCHVMAVAVHPSAKLGLSVGSDRTFFTWDLTTGKLAFKRKTDQVAQDIQFTRDGNNYVLVYQRKIEVCSLEDTMVLQEIDLNCRINSVCFVENYLAVGGDDGQVSIVDINSGSQILQEKCKGRVKSLYTLSTKTDNLLFAAFSNGCVRVYKLDFTEGSEKMDTVVVFESGVRITCMTAYAPSDVLKEEVNRNGSMRDKRKRKRRAYEEDEDNDVSKEDDNGINDEGNSEKESDDEDVEDAHEDEEQESEGEVLEEGADESHSDEEDDDADEDGDESDEDDGESDENGVESDEDDDESDEDDEESNGEGGESHSEEDSEEESMKQKLQMKKKTPKRSLEKPKSKQVKAETTSLKKQKKSKSEDSPQPKKKKRIT